MTTDPLLVARDGPLAIVTINRPEKRNAVSFAMWRRLAAIFEELGADAAVRVVILTGAGGHFSAGADIGEFAALRDGAAAGIEYERAGEAAMRAIHDCPKPVIAEIAGYCVGGGLGLALACDFRVAAAGARFGIPAARLGIVYGILETQLLIAAAGPRNAKRILMSATIVPVEEAASLGLVDEIAPDARSVAARLAANAPLSMEGAKLIVNAIAAGETAERHGAIDAFIDRVMDSADYGEGRRAFAEKRPPVFTGR